CSFRRWHQSSASGTFGRVTNFTVVSYVSPGFSGGTVGKMGPDVRAGRRPDGSSPRKRAKSATPKRTTSTAMSQYMGSAYGGERAPDKCAGERELPLCARKRRSGVEILDAGDPP